MNLNFSVCDQTENLFFEPKCWTLLVFGRTAHPYPALGTSKMRRYMSVCDVIISQARKTVYKLYCKCIIRLNQMYTKVRLDYKLDMVLAEDHP